MGRDRPALGIKQKLLLSFCFAELCVIGLLTVVVGANLSGSIRSQSELLIQRLEVRGEQRLRGDLRLLQSLLEQELDRCERAALLVSESPGALSALETFDPKFFTPIVTSVAGAAEVDLLQVLDLSGVVVASFPRDVDDFASAEALRDWPVLNSLFSSGTEEEQQTGLRSAVSLPAAFLQATGLGSGIPAGQKPLGLLAARRLDNDFGEPLGLVVACKVINRKTEALEELHRISGNAAAVYTGKSPIAWYGFSKLTGARKGSAVPHFDAASSGGDNDSGGRFRLSISYADTLFLAAATPLKSIDGENLGHLVVAEPLASFHSVRDELERGSEMNRDQILLWIVVVGVVGLAVFAVAAYGISARILGAPLKRVGAGLRSVAEGAGDLTLTLAVPARDEIGSLADSFNLFVSRLRDMVIRTRDAVEVVGAATQRIESAAVEVKLGADKQSERLEVSHQTLKSIDDAAGAIADRTQRLLLGTEINTSTAQQMGATVGEIALKMDDLFGHVAQVSNSVEGMSAVSQQITTGVEGLATSAEQAAAALTQMDQNTVQIQQSAQNAHELAEETNRYAVAGKHSVDVSVNGIVALNDVINRSTAVIRELDQKSAAIGRILTVIRGVADRTGLLALNASIIAAQAGEHGTGFGVVANEIKALAGNTVASAKEISQIIHDLQEVARAAVETAESGRLRAEEEVERAREAGASLEEILHSTAESRTRAAEIAEAIREQSDSSRLVTHAVDQLAAMLGQIMSAVQDQNREFEILTRGAVAMREIASVVQIGANEQAEGSRQIAGSMEEMRSLTAQIEEEAREQMQRSQDAFRLLSEVLEITTEQSDRTVELEQTVSHLAKQAESLRSEVRSFKV